MGLKGALYENSYYCSGDNEYRSRHPPFRCVDLWSCMCNDRCPVCRTEIEPYASIDTSNGSNVIHAPKVYRRAEKLL